MRSLSWIAGGLAIVGTAALAAALWFDRLFEAPTATWTASLVQHLRSRSVLAVLAHPDDETLIAGVLSDAASRDGVDVRTITLTRGEKGTRPPHLVRAEDLARVRESELRRYGSALGIDHQDLWDYPDGGLVEVPSRDIIDRLVERVRASSPDLVLTFDPAGGYDGHPDHRAVGMLTTNAIHAALDPAYESELGSAHRPLHLAYVVAPARALSSIGGPTLRVVAAAQPAPNVAVPVKPDVRILGWRTHESQRLDKAYPLPGWLLFNFWDKEHYVVFAPMP